MYADSGSSVEYFYVNQQWLHSDLPADVLNFVSSFSFYFTGQCDNLVWKLESSGKFTLSSAYHLVHPSVPASATRSIVWNSRIPTRISFLFWSMRNRLFPFPDILRRMGFHLPSKCPHCDDGDSFLHYFILCPFAKQLWGWI